MNKCVSARKIYGEKRCCVLYVPYVFRVCVLWMHRRSRAFDHGKTFSVPKGETDAEMVARSYADEIATSLISSWAWSRNYDVEQQTPVRTHDYLHHPSKKKRSSMKLWRLSRIMDSYIRTEIQTARHQVFPWKNLSFARSLRMLRIKT